MMRRGRLQNGGVLSSGGVPGSHRPLTKLDLDAAFFWLILVFLVTVVMFLNLRDRHIELSPSQIAEYERRTQSLANSTVYIVEVHRPEGLLSNLAPKDWLRVASNVDYVAFVYDDLPVFLADDWIAKAEKILHDDEHPAAHRIKEGIGIVLFPCGCILPNVYFGVVEQRLGGMECVLLPGWVLPHEDVHWLPDGLDKQPLCKRQKRVVGSRVVYEYATQLGKIRTTLEKAREEAESRLAAIHLTNSSTAVAVQAAAA